MAARRPRPRTGVRPNAVERSIYFYKMDFGLDDAGQPIAGDLVPALRHIDSLEWTPDGRYFDLGEDNFMCCWVDRATQRARVRLATSRRSSLPQRELAGQLSAVPLAPAAGLVEVIHIEFFPDDIVGADFNFYGPRVQRFGDYLAVKAQGIAPPVTFLPLVRRDVAQQLGRFQDIRLFQLKIHASYATTVRGVNASLGGAFQAARRAGGVNDDVELEIVIRPKEYSRDSALGGGLLTTARRLAARVDLLDNAARFLVGGLDRETNKVEKIDLLRDQLISKKQIVKQGPRTRALLASSAYAAIGEAHFELRDELTAAAALSR